ncbi:MAG TPA: hypothetical protein VJN94_10820 [Candidatus Binataceae bacterium]|nr:hypothetical protein [Candidatus Binataceae bacterium]
MPVSMLRAAPALVLLAIAAANLNNYADTDLWGHVYFGNIILRHGPYLGPERFSYTAVGHAWLDHEWLCEALMAMLYSTFGTIGLQFWKLACTAVTIVFLADGIGETSAPIEAQAPVLLASALALAPYMQFRPQLFSFVMFAALLAGIARDNFGRHAPLWLAIPGFALWANLHGGFFVGVAMLGIYAAIRGARDLAPCRAQTCFSCLGTRRDNDRGRPCDTGDALRHPWLVYGCA